MRSTLIILASLSPVFGLWTVAALRQHDGWLLAVPAIAVAWILVAGLVLRSGPLPGGTRSRGGRPPGAPGAS